MKIFTIFFVSVVLAESHAFTNNGSDIDDRAGIVGGTEVRDMRMVPYAAKVNIEKINGQGTYGGGTLIAPAVMVTAAHVTDEARRVIATAGHPYDKERSPNKQVRISTTWIHHPDFTPETMNADICVVYFHNPFVRTPQVQFAVLPKPTVKLHEGQKLRVSGWGRLGGEDFSDGERTEVLQTVELPYIPTETCRTYYDKLLEGDLDYEIDGGISYTVQEDTLCAGYWNRGGKDACKGDSGGPAAFYAKKTHQHVLIGVVSWGLNCGRPKFPGIYTDVRKYYGFIKSCVNVFKEGLA